MTTRDVFAIDGMFCAACAAGVEATLARLPGVKRAAVSFAADAAVVEWDGTARDTPALLTAVRRLGYAPRLLDGTTEDGDPAPDPARSLGLRLAVAVFFGMWMMLPTLGLYLGVASTPAVELGLAYAAGTLSLPVLLYSGLPFYRMGFLTLRSGVPGVDALVAIGVVTSVALSGVLLATGRGEVYFEVAVMLITLQLLARVLDLRVRRRARDATAQMLALAPARVTVVNETGLAREQFLPDVPEGATVLLGAGQHVAVDGVVRAGTASIDRSLLTGEAAPQVVGPGDNVRAGERVLDGRVQLRVTACAGQRRLDDITRLVRATLAGKPAWQRVVDRVARHFLWLAAAAAVLGAMLAMAAGASTPAALERALAVFVIACPCALALAAPLAGLVAAGAGAREGIVLRDLSVVTNRLPQTLFLDKTGTLTRGAPALAAARSLTPGLRDEEVLALAAEAEQGVEHPLARAIVAAAPGEPKCAAAARQSVAPGGGVTYQHAGKVLRVGSADWLRGQGLCVPDVEPTSRTRVWVARDTEVVGVLELHDPLRPGVGAALATLQASAMEATVLSGDAQGPVEALAAQLGLPARASLSPEQKASMVEVAKGRGTTAFVGDGLNDGPALAAADLGIAVAGATDVACAASAVTLTSGGVERLPRLFELLRRARRTVRRNITFALLYNLVAVPFALAGWVHPAIAAIAMAASSLTVVLSSLALDGRRSSRSG